MSHAQKAMFEIGNFLIALAVVLALILVAARVYTDIVIADTWNMATALNILQFVLILLIASIPVAMPAVFSITMALGALDLSRQKAIVSRLSAIEEMAGVDILCSDKTGTLTKNQLSVGDPILFQASDGQACILAAALASRAEDHDPIDDAVLAALKSKAPLADYKSVAYQPFDPVTKRTAATVSDAKGQHDHLQQGCAASDRGARQAGGRDCRQDHADCRRSGGQGLSRIGGRQVGRWRQGLGDPRTAADVRSAAR